MCGFSSSFNVIQYCIEIKRVPLIVLELLYKKNQLNIQMDIYSYIFKGPKSRFFMYEQRMKNKQEKHTWIIESKKKLIGFCDKYPTSIYNRRPAETWDLEIYRKMFSCKRLNDFRMRIGNNLGKSILISWQFGNTNCYLFDTVSESWELSIVIASRFHIIRPGLVTFGRRGDYTKNLSEIGKDT